MSHDGHSHSQPGPAFAPGAVSAAAAAIEASLTLVPLTLNLAPTPQNPDVVSLGPNAPASFSPLDLATLNPLVRFLSALHQHNPALVFPPQPQPQPNERSNHVARAKEAGNAAFKAQNFGEAAKLYTMSAEIAGSRPAFEASVYARDELALALSNRSAAFLGAGLKVEALADADAVIQLKRPWVKGHFRRGKALAAMERWEEANEALLLGLQFDPASEVSKLLQRISFITPAPLGLPARSLPTRFPPSREEWLRQGRARLPALGTR